MADPFLPVLLGPRGEPITRVRKVSKAEAVRIANDPETQRFILENALVRGQVAAVGGNQADVQDYVVGGEVITNEQWETIAKRVKTRGTSLQQVWDPARGKPKPTSVTYQTLRQMANRSEWARAIIKTRKNQIGSYEWSIQPKDADDKSPSTKRLCETIDRFLRRPSMHGSRPSSRSWRQFIQEVLEDLLVLDAGVFEKERNMKKWPIAMYPVDGATIHPNIDEYGGYHLDAYVQIIDGQVVARLGMEDLVYMMDNPQTDVRFMGYGYSPLEHLIVSVCAELYASKYNSSYFEKGSVPEGLLNLGEDAAPEDVDEFRLYWMNEIMGKPWAIPIIGGKGVEWVEWRQSNKDMEYMAYQEWLLKKMCAVYQIAPQEVGLLEDVNRSTAEEQAGSNDSTSINPILNLTEDVFEVEVIGEHGFGVSDIVVFKFDREDEDLQLIDQAYQIRVGAGAATRQEWRKAVNMEPSDDPGAELLLVSGQLQGLPTQQDVALSSASGQAAMQEKQADQQAQMAQEQGMGGGGMPWKPADPSDPDVIGARDKHQDELGAGPAGPPAAGPPQLNAGPKPPKQIGKTVDWDRNPAQSEVTDSFERMLDRKQGELLDGLEDVLGIPMVGSEL